MNWGFDRWHVRALLFRLTPHFLKPWWRRIEASALGNRLATGAFWSTVGALISRVLSLLSFIVAARVLGKEGFGELGIIQGTVGALGVFAGMGLGVTATKHVAEFRISNPQRAGSIIALSELVSVFSGLVITIALVVLAPWLAEHTLAAPHLSKQLRIGAGLLLLGALNGAQGGALVGFEAFKALASISFWTGLVSFPLLVGGVWFAGLAGAVWALVAGLVVNLILNHIALRREAIRASVPIEFAGCWREWPVLWEFSFPAVLGGVMVGPVNWFCNAMLVNQPNGYAEMGIFNAANQWRMAIVFFPTTVAAIVLPVLANLRGAQDQNSYNKVLWYNVLLNGGMALLVAFVVIACSPWLMSSYGASFRTGWLALDVLALTAVIYCVGSVVGQAITSAGKMWHGFLINFSWAVVMLLAAFLLVKKGALGLAVASFIAYLFLLIAVSVYTRWVLLKK